MAVSLSACVSNKKDTGLISTSLSISSYAEASMRAHAVKESQYDFPMLEIYNGSGILVYRGHDSTANARVLKEFPNSVQSLQPQEDAPRLAKILEAIPDFREREQEIVGRNKSVILSIGLEHCKGCIVQEDALQAAKQHLLRQQSVEILEINVFQP
jgi:hypothetical protein